MRIMNNVREFSNMTVSGNFSYSCCHCMVDKLEICICFSFCDDYHQDFVTGIAWEPKSNRLFSCGWDTNVGGREVVTMDTLASPLATMDISEKLNASKESPEIMDDSPQCNGFAEESISNGNIVEAKG